MKASNWFSGIDQQDALYKAMWRRHKRGCSIILAFLVMYSPWLVRLAWGDAGVLQVLVQDAHRHPVRGIEIGIDGIGGARTTGDDGKALLPLPKDAAENDWVSLQIIHSPPGRDFVIVSPFDNRTLIPSFKNKPENVVRIMVIERGDFAALQEEMVLANLTAKITKTNASKESDAEKDDPRSNLEKVAKLYGLKAEDLDAAIRAWGAKTTNPYDAGLAALYERNFQRASGQLQEAFRTGEEKLNIDQKVLADTAFFLGYSLSQEGKYSEATKAYQRCLQLEPSNTTAMVELSFVLMHDGNYGSAEALLRQALAIDEKVSGTGSPAVANDLNRLASLFAFEGREDEAESNYRRSLAIWEKVEQPGSMVGVAIALNNIATIRYDKGDLAEAERLWRRALSIGEQVAPESWDVVSILSSLGTIQRRKGDYVGADALFQRAIAICYKKPQAEHVASMELLNEYALLLMDTGDYATAEDYFRRALAIGEKLCGPDGPCTVKIREHLEELRDRQSQTHQN